MTPHPDRLLRAVVAITVADVAVAGTIGRIVGGRFGWPAGLAASVGTVVGMSVAAEAGTRVVRWVG